MGVSALPPSDERAGVTRLRQPQAPVAQPAHQASEQCRPRLSVCNHNVYLENPAS